MIGRWLGSRTLPNQPQMAIWWPNEHPPRTVSHPQRAPRCASECGDRLHV